MQSMFHFKMAVVFTGARLTIQIKINTNICLVLIVTIDLLISKLLVNVPFQNGYL